MPTLVAHPSTVLPRVLSRWVVKIGDAGCRSGADDFAAIEGVVARIVAGDDGPAESVADAFEAASPARAQRVVASIFARDGWHDEFDPVVLVGLVDEAVPEIAAIAGGALVKLGSLIGGLMIAGEKSGDEERGIVEAVLGCGNELFLDRLRWKMGKGADRAEVGEDSQDALGLRVGVGGGRSGRGGRLLRLWRVGEFGRGELLGAQGPG